MAADWSEREISALRRMSDTRLANLIDRPLAEVKRARKDTGIARDPDNPMCVPAVHWANPECMWNAHSYAFFEPPKCKRAIRVSMQEQWELCIDLAIAYADGWASHRTVFSARMGESYVYWPTSTSPSGWWMIPIRIASRVALLRKSASRTLHRTRLTVSSDEVASLLRRWRQTKQWRRHACKIRPIHSADGAPVVFPPQRQRRASKKIIA